MYTLTKLKRYTKNQLIDIIIDMQKDYETDLKTLEHDLNDANQELAEEMEFYKNYVSPFALTQLLYDQSKEVGIIFLRQQIEDSLAELQKYYG